MNRVGLFFGSFDPPHIGHANVVMGVVNSKLVDKVLVIPAYQNVWKSNSSEFSYRLAMCKMTFSPLAPEVYVNAVEKSMYVPSYSKYNKFHDDYHPEYLDTSDIVIFILPDVSFSTPLHRLTNGILSELIKVINSNKPYFIAYGPKGSSDMCIYPGSLNLTSGVTDKEFINFNDTY